MSRSTVFTPPTAHQPVLADRSNRSCAGSGPPPPGLVGLSLNGSACIERFWMSNQELQPHLLDSFPLVGAKSLGGCFVFLVHLRVTAPREGVFSLVGAPSFSHAHIRRLVLNTTRLESKGPPRSTEHAPKPRNSPPFLRIG